ncbi:MAG: isoleucine--tRNA ligase, partial [Pseudomonadota bacterium]|nr:isoleucine--tRNA ligase [Pseudomonadota bacterium]
EINWAQLCELREGVKKVLEDLRVAGQIGSGLNAKVTLFVDPTIASSLRELEGELRFWFITSEATLADAAQRSTEAVEFKLESGCAVWIVAGASGHAKCERCWHQRADVGAEARHPTLCLRCVDNVDGTGETRRYL